MTHIYCDNCGGEGTVTYTGSGYFSSAQEQWYPDEYQDACDKCNGTGYQYMEDEDEED